jgi:hypothetical protein
MMMKNKLAWLVFLLVILNGIVLIRHYELKRELDRESAKSDSTVSLAQEILRQSFHTLQGHTYRLADAVDPHLLIFIFRPTDCSACLEELRLYTTRQTNLSVYGIALDTNETELRQFLPSAPIPFPVVLDWTGWLSRRFPDKSTPSKLLIHRETGRLLLTDAPNPYASDQQRFLEQVKRAVSMQN